MVLVTRGGVVNLMKLQKISGGSVRSREASRRPGRILLGRWNLCLLPAGVPKGGGGEWRGLAMQLLEEGEVYATVLALFHEAGMIGEIVVLAMFQYQEAIFAQEVSFQNHVG